MTELEAALRLTVAALTGLAVGVEREWSGHASGPEARFAGVRTFFLLGVIGGIAGWMVAEHDALLGVAVLAAAGALVVAAYWAASRRGPEAVEGTTETAAILVLGTGLAAGLGHLRLASGIAAVTVLALAEKDTIRRFIARIDNSELRAALHFAVLALVVLPLLPAGPIAALGGVQPRVLWAVVLIFSGINFASYLVRRAVGDARGYPLTGALGGVVSSTAVTLSYARQSRVDPANSSALAAGTLAACTVLVPRILVVTVVLNPRLLPVAALGLAPVLLAGAGAAFLLLRHAARDEVAEGTPPARNPLQLVAAIKMTLAFQVVLWALALLGDRFGSGGVLAGAAVIGFTDMDALTFGMNRLAADPDLVATAAMALVIGVVSNTLLKTGVALVAGEPDFRRRTVPALLAIAVAGAGGGWLVSLLGT